MPTLRDLGRHLGLSVTQVSRALNGHSDVGQETRERVMAAARALNYQPNLSARKLVSGRSGIVALVLPEVPAPPYDSLFVQIVGGLSQQFSTRNMQFVLHISATAENPLKVYERLVNSGSLDGFVVLDPVSDDPRITFLRARKVPFVLHGRMGPEPDHPFYDIDNDAVGYLLARSLLTAGHKRIAFLNGQAGRTYAEARASGFLRACAEMGVPVDLVSLRHGEMNEGYGLIETARLWAETKPPTGIACGNLLIAKGVIAALGAIGAFVPQDVSVVAHDDELPGLDSAWMPVPLTVTRSPLQESWGPLADILAGAISGAPITDLQRFGRISFIERASVRTPSKPL